MKAKPAVSNIICFEHRLAAFFKALQLPLGFGAKAFRWRTGDNHPFPFRAGCQGMPTVTCNASSISILPAGDKRAGSAGAHQFGHVPTVLQYTVNSREWMQKLVRSVVPVSWADQIAMLNGVYCFVFSFARLTERWCTAREWLFSSSTLSNAYKHRFCHASLAIFF